MACVGQPCSYGTNYGYHGTEYGATNPRLHTEAQKHELVADPCRYRMYWPHVEVREGEPTIEYCVPDPLSGGPATGLPIFPYTWYIPGPFVRCDDAAYEHWTNDDGSCDFPVIPGTWAPYLASWFAMVLTVTGFVLAALFYLAFLVATFRGEDVFGARELCAPFLKAARGQPAKRSSDESAMYEDGERFDLAFFHVLVGRWPKKAHSAAGLSNP